MVGFNSEDKIDDVNETRQEIIEMEQTLSKKGHLSTLKANFELLGQGNGKFTKEKQHGLFDLRPSMEVEVNRLNAKVLDQESTIDDLQEQIKAAKNDLQENAMNFEDIERSLKVAAFNFENLQVKYDKLDDEYKVINEKNDELANEMQRKNASINKLEEELRQYVEAKEALETELYSEKEKLNAAEISLKQQTLINVDNEEKIAELNERKDCLEKEKDEIENKLEVLDKSFSAASINSDKVAMQLEDEKKLYLVYKTAVEDQLRSILELL